MEDFMKKVLVTGAAGFIGKSLVKELIDRGTEVYAVVNNSRLDTSGIQTDMLHIIQCDLSRDTSGIEALEDKGIDVVYHLAWRGSYGPERCDISIQLGNVYIDVVDKGKGIEQEFASNVFDRLYTMEDSRNREIQGNGLGLTIAKNLAKQLEGDIFLDSIPNVKTTFTVKLKKITY